MKRIILAALLTVTLTNCKEDFLDRSSLTQIAENNFWQSEADAFLALNAVYSTLQAQPMYGGSLNAGQGYPGYDNIGDNAFNQFKWEGPGLFMEGTINQTHFWFNNHWTNLYQGIVRANSVVDNVLIADDNLISPEKKNELLGQAYFLRGLMYFNLAMYFEDVPLITEPQTLDNAFVGKSTYAEVISQVNQDLNFAIDNLPETYASDLYGYATKGAALALKARVQLYNKNYTGPDGVLELTEQVMGLGYSLHPEYGDLFSTEGEYSNEVIFSIRFLRGDDTNNGETFSATFAGTPKVDQRPMPNLVNDYYCTDGLPVTESPLFDPANQGLNRDPRANATIYFAGDEYLTDLAKIFSGNSPTRYGMRKYIRRSADADGNAVFGQGSQDFYVMRYADVLLMRAEAMAETGDITGAMEMVNTVRARVNMPSVEEVEGLPDQSQMIEIVRHERRVELALEGLRFMDLKRWGEMEAAYERAVNDPVGPFNPQYLGKRSEVFPVPQNEIDVNPNLTQHPAW